MAAALLALACADRGGRGGGPPGGRDVPLIGLQRGGHWSVLTIRPPHLNGPQFHMLLKNSVLTGAVSGGAAPAGTLRVNIDEGRRPGLRAAGARVARLLRRRGQHHGRGHLERRPGAPGVRQGLDQGHGRLELVLLQQVATPRACRAPRPSAARACAGRSADIDRSAPQRRLLRVLPRLASPPTARSTAARPAPACPSRPGSRSRRWPGLDDPRRAGHRAGGGAVVAAHRAGRGLRAALRTALHRLLPHHRRQRGR